MTPPDLMHCVVNGERQEIDGGSTLPVLDWLRDELRLTDTHRGCDSGHCGSCAVRIDGVAVKACSVMVGELGAARLETVEALAGVASPAVRDVLKALMAPAVFQCNFCAPAFVFAAIELIERTPQPTQDQVRRAFDGLLCRCTGYQSIVEAVMAACAAAAAADTAASGGERPGDA